MNTLQACYLLTEDLIAILKQATADQRDNVIEKMKELLSKREQVLQLIKPPFSEQEHSAGLQLMEQQKELDQLLLQVKLDIQRDISGLSKKKVSINRYTNPYENMQTDGFFYDKRK